MVVVVVRKEVRVKNSSAGIGANTQRPGPAAAGLGLLPGAEDEALGGQELLFLCPGGC